MHVENRFVRFLDEEKKCPGAVVGLEYMVARPFELSSVVDLKKSDIPTYVYILNILQNIRRRFEVNKLITCIRESLKTLGIC